MRGAPQGCNYSCAITTGDGKAIYAVGSDKKLKQLADTEGTGLITVAEYASKSLITQIALPSSAPILHSQSLFQGLGVTF